MITLPDEATTAIDAAIASALARLHARAAPRGDTARALIAATERAATGGKRFRPALVVASFEALAGDAVPTPALWDVAAAFELLHTAFVIHDDIIDRDTERRGAPNVSGEFRRRAQLLGAAGEDAALMGEAAALLAGDLLLFEASRTIACAEIPTDRRTMLFSLLEEAVVVSAAGELSDVEHATGTDCPDTAALLATAHDKTAVYSFLAPLSAGAVLAGAGQSERAAIRVAAAHLGLAFQLVDDLIGTFGTHEQAGREPGADLREAKLTPLIGLARESADWQSISSALALAPSGPVAVRRAQQELDASGARERLVGLVEVALCRARTHAADPCLPNPAVELLATLAAAIEQRIP